MRGRGNNPNNNNSGNRKGPNPLTRNYESNGPDVKIRGSAQQIADKYQALARDAQSAGDRVMAENYLQHAEHYNRIIAAAQAQFAVQHGQRDQRGDADENDDEDRDDFEQPQAAAEKPRREQAHQSQPVDGSGPQPVIEGLPAEVALEQEASGGSRGDGQEDARKANGAHQPEAASEDAPPPRRARRPRRPRSRDGEGAGEAEAASDAAPADSQPERLAVVNE